MNPMIDIHFATALSSDRRERLQRSHRPSPATRSVRRTAPAPGDNQRPTAIAVRAFEVVPAAGFETATFCSGASTAGALCGPAKTLVNSQRKEASYQATDLLHYGHGHQWQRMADGQRGLRQRPARPGTTCSSER